MALCGVALTSDVVHGKASEAFGKDFGYGPWFAPLVGLWEAAIAGLLWIDGGAHRATGLQMVAVVLGGAVYRG